MELKDFLRVSLGLAGEKELKVKIDGYELFFEVTGSSWQISTMICNRGSVPLSLLNSLALSRFSVFEKQGIFLKRCAFTGSLILTKKTGPLNQFEDFEKAIHTFIKVCDNWKSLIDEEHRLAHHFSFKEV